VTKHPQVRLLGVWSGPIILEGGGRYPLEDSGIGFPVSGFRLEDSGIGFPVSVPPGRGGPGWSGVVRLAGVVRGGPGWSGVVRLAADAAPHYFGEIPDFRGQ
jgi:hypothetical protein